MFGIVDIDLFCFGNNSNVDNILHNLRKFNLTLEQGNDMVDYFGVNITNNHVQSCVIFTQSGKINDRIIEALYLTGTNSPKSHLNTHTQSRMKVAIIVTYTLIKSTWRLCCFTIKGVDVLN